LDWQGTMTIKVLRRIRARHAGCMAINDQHERLIHIYIGDLHFEGIPRWHLSGEGKSPRTRCSERLPHLGGTEGGRVAMHSMGIAFSCIVVAFAFHCHSLGLRPLFFIVVRRNRFIESCVGKRAFFRSGQGAGLRRTSSSWLARIGSKDRHFCHPGLR
jgi:hypothetical protein